MSYAFLALIAAICLLALIPTRRLYLAGWSSRSLLAYFVSLVGLGIVVAELRAPARFLIPILVVVYIAPFITARAGLARLFDRAAGRPSIVVRPADVPRLPDEAGTGRSGSGTVGPESTGTRVSSEPTETADEEDAHRA